MDCGICTHCHVDHCDLGLEGWPDVGSTCRSYKKVSGMNHGLFNFNATTDRDKCVRNYVKESDPNNRNSKMTQEQKQIGKLKRMVDRRFDEKMLAAHISEVWDD